MLFQAVVIFLPILNFFKFHVKGERSIHVSTFRTVWPLELLAFIASCHALKLNNQSWIDKFEDTQHATQKNINPSNTKPTSTETIECKTNITSNAENIQILEQSDVPVLNIVQTYKEQGLPNIVKNVTLNHLFQRKIKAKKQYEINVLSKVCVSAIKRTYLPENNEKRLCPVREH